MVFPSYGTSFIYQDFEQGAIQENDGGDELPIHYDGTGGGPGGAEGGPFVASLVTTDKVKGTQCLRMRIAAGSTGGGGPTAGLYAQFNPYGGSPSRKFSRQYAVDARVYSQTWTMNTFTHMRLWLKVPSIVAAGNYQSANYYLGAFIKAVTGASPTSDEEPGGGHPYLEFQVPPGLWTQAVLNAHADHWRGEGGSDDSGYDLYPTSNTTPWYGNGSDPPTTYTFWDTLTRFYVSHTRDDAGVIASNTCDFFLDQIEFWSNPYNSVEANQYIYSLSGAHNPATGRIYVGWSFLKSYGGIFNVRYAFSDIHALGYTNATVPPGGGVVTPVGDGGWNCATYDSTELSGVLAGHDSLFIAIKPTTGSQSGTFTQIEIPLSLPLADDEPDVTPPSVPTGLAASNIKPMRLTLTWNASTDAEVAPSAIHYEWRRDAGSPTVTAAGVTTAIDMGLTPSTEYTYDVRAVDPSDNASAFSTSIDATTLAPDVTAPSTPTWGTATAVSSVQINLSWNASTDNIDAAGDLVYRVFRNAGLVHTTAAGVTTFADTGLSPSTEYTYTLEAVDTSTNASSVSSALAETTLSGPTPLAAYAFSEGTGTTTADDTGNGRTGTLSNGATWATGHTGQALSLVGGASRMAVAGFAATTNKTYSCWVFIDTHTADYNTIFEFGNDAPWLGVRSTGVLEVYPTGPVSPGAVGTGQWHHIAYTSDAPTTTGRLYIDGTLVATGAHDTQTGVGLSVGQGSGDTSLDGQVDDVRIYDTALTQAQIEDDMNTPVGGAGGDTLAPAAPTNLRVLSS